MRDQKYQIGTKSGSIIWDIDLLLSTLDLANFTIHDLPVDELLRKNRFNGNPEAAMLVDLNIPFLIAELLHGKEKLIDGNHRLYKAKALNLSTIPCYILPLHVHQAFIVNFDPVIYTRVAEEF